MFSPSRKKRKVLDNYQGECCEAESGPEPERVHKGAVADVCGHVLDMRSLLYSLNSLLAEEKTSADRSTANLESERPLAVSGASSVEESDRYEDKLMVGRKSSEEELETIEDRQDVASSSVEPTSASSSFFHRKQSFFASNFGATQSRYGSQPLPSKVTDITANPPQNN